MIRVMTLPKQLHLSRLGDTEPSKFNEVELQDELWKPSAGLWTCDLRRGHRQPTSDWVQWCRENQPDWLDRQRNVLQPLPARCIVLDNVEAVMWLDERYRCPIPVLAELALKHRDRSTFWTIDWKRASEDIDVIRFDYGWYREANWLDLELHMKMWLYGWDVDSNYWMNWMFE